MRLYQISLVPFFLFSFFSFCLDFSLSSSVGANSPLFHFVLHIIYILLFSSQGPFPNCCPFTASWFLWLLLIVYSQMGYGAQKYRGERACSICTSVSELSHSIYILGIYPFSFKFYFSLQMNSVHMSYIFIINLPVVQHLGCFYFLAI